MKETYTITVDRPSDVSVADMKDFLRSAEGWKGAYRLEDPRHAIKILAIKRER